MTLQRQVPTLHWMQPNVEGCRVQNIDKVVDAPLRRAEAGARMSASRRARCAEAIGSHDPAGAETREIP